MGDGRRGGRRGRPASSARLPASVSMHENVTTAHAVVLSCLRRPDAGAALVCCAGDFPSTIYLLRAQEALGFDLDDRAGRSRSSAWTCRRVVDAIDDTHRAGRACRTCSSAAPSSWIPRPIVERAHAVGAHVVLDTYQSAGIIPVDVTALGVDFATGGCLKWLCGGPGNAFLYTRPGPAARSLRPRLTGWFSHSDPFAFDLDDLRAACRRASDDERHAVHPRLARRAAGPRHPRTVGIGAVRGRSQALDRAAAGRSSTSTAIRTVAPRIPDRLAGTVAIDVPDALQVASHAQRPRFRRRLPAGRRHPRVAAFLQHRGRDRRTDLGIGAHPARPATTMPERHGPRSSPDRNGSTGRGIAADRQG